MKEEKEYICDKCLKEFDFIELNNNEYDEFKELGHFTCSSCINEEMEEENKKVGLK